MSGGPPSIYRKNTGNHCVKWGGVEHSLGKDLDAAQKKFLDPAGVHPGALVHWLRWKESSKQQRAARRGSPTIADLAKEFLADYYENGRIDTEVYYRGALRRFLNSFGRIRTADFSVQAFDAFRKSLLRLKLKPRTMVHDLKAVKTLWAWGHPRSLCPPIDFRGVKMPRSDRSLPEPIPREQIRNIVTALESFDRPLAAWVAFSYLTGCRPSEVVRVARGEGRLITFPPEGNNPAIHNAAVELAKHKTVVKSRASRYLLLNTESLMWFPHVKPLPSPRKTAATAKSVLNRYGKSLREAGHAGLAHKLRDSAATHLMELGVDQGSVDLILGHAPKGELANYGRPALRVLHSKVALLSLK